jgi:hypothetical protein
VQTKRVLLYLTATTLLAIALLSAARSPLPEVLTNAAVTVLLMVPSALLAIHLQKLAETRNYPAKTKLRDIPAMAVHPTPAPARSIAAVLNHCGPPWTFPDEPLVEDQSPIIKPASDYKRLRSVQHAILAQAATFRCRYCERDYIAGMPKPEIDSERQQLVMNAKRKRLRIAAALLGPIWLGYGYLTIGLTGSIAAFFSPWLLAVAPGWLSMVVLSFVIQTKVPPVALVLNPVTNKIDDGHLLTVQ